MSGIDKIRTWLKKRRDLNRHPPAPHYWQIFAVVAANLVVLSFLVFDQAVGAIRQRDIGQCRTRCDLAVALDRDLGRIEPDRAHQIGDRTRRGAARW